ncbi:hypothetical protein PPTG_22679 [Phytophthora nicotianae INRA-310]|uniref:CCHC-type domain-containing protein n=1 Tax=Phytophthora nicotianae (strain INRA-310) TaxID=761204 RepID=W2QBZ1_PHYN3|nr:hypothetical protein PPTG_22679 [Phytophthora nicotianae INRA-310]ETN10682.1 hypothetical protein PPTG_22679 [Phytophthora nicotianae INRA-310]
MTLLEGHTQVIHELSHTVATQHNDFRSSVMDQLQHQQSSREFKIEGASMPKFYGKLQESVDEFIFEAKLFMNGKNIDYGHPANPLRVVARLASNLRDGAASWYHNRIMIGKEPISSIDEFESALRDEFLPPDQQHRLRAALRSCKQTTDVEEYVSRFRKIIAQVRDMSALVKVDHFIMGLKPETRKEVNYLNRNSLNAAISAAQAYERAHFGGGRRSHAARRDGPEPMDIYQVIARPTLEQCHRQRLCFYCRESGHRISDCPKKRQRNDGAQRT